jgi:hypothetical protein
MDDENYLNCWADGRPVQNDPLMALLQGPYSATAAALEAQEREEQARIDARQNDAFLALCHGSYLKIRRHRLMATWLRPWRVAATWIAKFFGKQIYRSGWGDPWNYRP